MLDRRYFPPHALTPNLYGNSGAASLPRGVPCMLTHHDNHRRFAATLTTSRCIDAAPRHLARLLQQPSLFTSSPVEPQRRTPIAIDLNPAPDRRGAVTMHCAQAGISERRPLQMRQLSPARLTAETGNGPALSDADETFALAMAVDLTPLVQPGPTIATRVTLSFQFVRERWWPRNLTDALSDLADNWLQRLEERAHATAPHNRPRRT